MLILERIIQMNEEEFRKTCKIRGLATVETVKSYIKRQNKEDYDEEDCIEVYRIEERRIHPYCPSGLVGDRFEDGYGDEGNYSSRKDDK